MHGTFPIATAIAFDPSFDTFISSLYDSGVLPPVVVVEDCDDDREYYKRTGRIPVLEQDESELCAVFGNWSTYYEFEGWLAYRALSRSGNEFQLMASDVLENVAWSPDTALWIGIISGLAVVQDKYAVKFGHHPADLNKFIKSYITYGEDTVLRRDVY